MNLLIEHVESMPRMSWVAVMHKGSTILTVFAGSAVDSSPAGIVEGAWNAPFEKMNFLEADLFCGSGFILDGDHVIFCTASHTFDRLFTIRCKDELWVSNSIIVLLAQSRHTLAKGYLNYESDLRSFINGLTNYVRRIPLENSNWLDIHYVCNIYVDRNLKISKQIRCKTPEFESFKDYRMYIYRELSRICRNAAQKERRQTFTPIATVSSGYDSPATAVLATECGATQAVTFSKGRDIFGQASDSGATIATRLGLEVHTKDRLDYLDRTDFPEAVFLATGAGGGDVVMSAFEKEFRDRCVFTGFLGDTLWAQKYKDVSLSKDFQFRYPGGGSLSEFRLRVGFIHLPVPLMTLRSHESIYRISNSAEMKKWCLGDDLSDRPIPRRIAETAGVDRQLFGQRKNAVNQPIYQVIDAGQMLSATSKSDLQIFWARGGNGTTSPPGFLMRLLNISFVETGLADALRNRVRKTRWASKFEPLFDYLRLKTASGATFHWGIAKAQRGIEDFCQRIPTDTNCS